MVWNFQLLWQKFFPHVLLVMQGTLVLCSCINSWFANGNNADCKFLQQIVETAERIIAVHQSSLTELHKKHCICHATSIFSEACHPSHGLFSPLLPGKRFRSIRISATRQQSLPVSSPLRPLTDSVPLSQTKGQNTPTVLKIKIKKLHCNLFYTSGYFAEHNSYLEQNLLQCSCNKIVPPLP